MTAPDLEQARFRWLHDPSRARLQDELPSRTGVHHGALTPRQARLAFAFLPRYRAVSR